MNRKGSRAARRSMKPRMLVRPPLARALMSSVAGAASAIRFALSVSKGGRGFCHRQDLPFNNLEFRRASNFILPRQGEVAPKATEGEVSHTLSVERSDSAPSVTLRVPPPPCGGGFLNLDTRWQGQCAAPQLGPTPISTPRGTVSLIAGSA